MIALVNRNLKIFFRDRAAVFFSLLAVFIVIGLYALFLGDSMRSSVTSQMEGITNARFLVDSWIMAGILAITSITTTMGAFGIMVEDKSEKHIKDFMSSPLKRSSLAGGYIISTYIIGVIMSIIAFILAEAYIVIGGGSLLSAFTMLKVLACILLSVLSSSAMVFFMVSFFKSQNAFATASTILGTLIGFLTGVYMPIGFFPYPIQFIVKIFPVSHAATLFRQIMMEYPIREGFAGAPPEVLNTFNEQFGVTFSFNGEPISWIVSVLFLIGTAALFYFLAIVNMSRKSKA